MLRERSPSDTASSSRHRLRLVLALALAVGFGCGEQTPSGSLTYLGENRAVDRRANIVQLARQVETAEHGRDETAIAAQLSYLLSLVEADEPHVRQSYRRMLDAPRHGGSGTTEMAARLLALSEALAKQYAETLAEVGWTRERVIREVRYLTDRLLLELEESGGWGSAVDDSLCVRSLVAAADASTYARRDIEKRLDVGPLRERARLRLNRAAESREERLHAALLLLLTDRSTDLSGMKSVLEAIREDVLRMTEEGTPTEAGEWLALGLVREVSWDATRESIFLDGAGARFLQMYKAGDLHWRGLERGLQMCHAVELWGFNSYGSRFGRRVEFRSR